MAPTQEAKYEELLRDTSLGDQKPSDLLVQMPSLLSGPPTPQEKGFIRTLFVQKLPHDVQYFLASMDPKLSLQEVAERADGLLRRFNSNAPAISAPVTVSSSPAAQAFPLPSTSLPPLSPSLSSPYTFSSPTPAVSSVPSSAASSSYPVYQPHPLYPWSISVSYTHLTLP